MKTDFEVNNIYQILFSGVDLIKFHANCPLLVLFLYSVYYFYCNLSFYPWFLHENVDKFF